VQNRSELVGLLDAAFGKQPLAWWLPRLAEIGVPAGEVRTLDRVYEWEQTRSQHLLVDVSHSSLGTVTLPGPPLRFFDDSGTEADLVHDAPPVLDEDGPAIRDWLDSLDG
jgi:crotonobetainyl-CoA:carnitine CoA-transferase CaiB-like acyl-CoA transferase